MATAQDLQVMRMLMNVGQPIQVNPAITPGQALENGLNSFFQARQQRIMNNLMGQQFRQQQAAAQAKQDNLIQLKQALINKGFSPEEATIAISDEVYKRDRLAAAEQAESIPQTIETLVQAGMPYKDAVVIARLGPTEGGTILKSYGLTDDSLAQMNADKINARADGTATPVQIASLNNQGIKSPTPQSISAGQLQLVEDAEKTGKSKLNQLSQNLTGQTLNGNISAQDALARMAIINAGTGEGFGGVNSLIGKNNFKTLADVSQNTGLGGPAPVSDGGFDFEGLSQAAGALAQPVTQPLANIGSTIVNYAQLSPEEQNMQAEATRQQLMQQGGQLFNNTAQKVIQAPFQIDQAVNQGISGLTTLMGLPSAVTGFFQGNADRAGQVLGTNPKKKAQVTRPTDGMLASINVSGGDFDPRLKVDAARRFNDWNNAVIDATGRPIPVVSAFRDAARNKRAGGAPNSKHTHGLAIDIDRNSPNFQVIEGLANQYGFGNPHKSFVNTRTGKRQSERNHFEFTGG